MMHKNELKYNAEGYYDPTAYHAMVKIEKQERRDKFRPLVFICSPYAGDIESNTIRARNYCKFAVEQNTIPIAPHLLYPQFMDENNPKDRNLGLMFGRILLDRCAEVWVFGDRISEGMGLEIKRAKHKDKIIRHFDTECREVLTDEFSKRTT